MVAARRLRLRAWIDAHYDGCNATFQRAIGINQGELSGLLHAKSFGEKKAAKLEAQARMPAGYLTTPLEPEHVDAGKLAAAIELVRQLEAGHARAFLPEAVSRVTAAVYEHFCTTEESSPVELVLAFGRLLDAEDRLLRALSPDALPLVL